jgi:HEAT repeat protein
MMKAEPNHVSEPRKWTLAASALGVTAAGVLADSAAVEKLIAEIQSPDDKVRGNAWQNAAPLGAEAVSPLAALMVHQDFEIARSAMRALWRIVRHVGRPKAEKERRPVQAELVALLDSAPAPERREALWMLSEIGDDRVVEPIAKMLADVEVREDARCALERMPSSKAIRALEHATKTAPEDFRPALANSLRVRGHDLRAYPRQKLQPSRPTSVEPKK